jgi:hypothetical protein
MGQREPGDDPNYFESTIAGLTDKLHITRDLAHQLKTRQQTKKDQWNAQNTQTAQDTAAGTLPYAMTPEGQAQAAKTSSALTEEAAKAKDASALKTQEGEQAIALEREKQKDKPSKGLKAMGLRIRTGVLSISRRNSGRTATLHRKPSKCGRRTSRPSKPRSRTSKRRKTSAWRNRPERLQPVLSAWGSLSSFRS